MRPTFARFALTLGFIGATSLAVLGCRAPDHPATDAPSATTEPARIELADDLHLRPIGPGLWVHTSFKDLPTIGRFPSNGLLLVRGSRATLVDTPWTPAQTRRLVRWLHDTLGAEVNDLVVTHAHDDRVGGLEELPRTARVHALALTAERAAHEGFRFVPEALQAEDARDLSGERVETFFPGPGHAPDNIVVWLPERRVLFGGCLVRALENRSLGNLADADVAHWPMAASRVLERYARASLVVPGHGETGGLELLVHTLELATGAARSSR